MKTKRNVFYATIRRFDFYVLLFFLLSYIGWLWEVAIYLVTEHAWINRGIYLGPYLPIYGAGGLLLWFLLHPLHEKKFLTFLLAAAVCSIVEYVTSVFLEWKWGMRWWDYSEFTLNLNGRICLLGAVCFGLGGMLLNCYLMPVYMRVYHKISPKWRRILCGILLLIFVLDATYCAVNPNRGRGISWQQNMVSVRTGYGTVASIYTKYSDGRQKCISQSGRKMYNKAVTDQNQQKEKNLW